MREISERDLAVLIPLLAAKIQDMTRELRALEGRDEADLSDEELDTQTDLQDMLAQYDQVLETLRQEYEEGLKDVSNLPSFEHLVRNFDLG